MLVEPISVAKPQIDTRAVAPKPKDQKTSEASARAPEKKEDNRQDAEFLQDVLGVVQKHFNVCNIGLDFSVHGETGRIKVSVMDKDTGKVIREVPPGQVLDLIAKIDEMMGILFDQKA